MKVYDLDISFPRFSYQTETARNLRNQNVMVWARQIGKTAELKDVMFQAGKRANTRYGYVTPTQKRSGEVHKEMAQALPAGFAEIREVQKQIWFPNGVVFDFASIEQHKGQRGGTWHGAIFDECQLMVESIIQQAFRPFLSSTGGWTIYCGTPPDPLDSPDPYFFEKLFKLAGGDMKEFGVHVSKDWMCSHFDYRARADIDPVYAKFVASEKETLPTERFEREYGAIFTKAGEGSFDCERLQWFDHTSDLKKSKKRMDVVINVDPSFKETEASDPRAIVVSGLDEEGNLYVLSAQQGRWGYDQFLDMIFASWDWAASEGWEPDYLELEVNGPGQAFYPALLREKERRRHRMRVLENTATQSKYNRILSLQPWVRDGQLWLQRYGWKHHVTKRREPGCRELEKQLEEFPRGLLHKNVKMDHHYDLADALAQRTWNFKPPKPKHKPKIETMPTRVVIDFAADYRKATKPTRRKRRKIYA